MPADVGPDSPGVGFVRENWDLGSGIWLTFRDRLGQATRRPLRRSLPRAPSYARRPTASGSAGRSRIGASFTGVAARPLGRSRGASQSAMSLVPSVPAASWATMAATGPGGSWSMSQPLRARNCSMAANATCWLPRRSGRCRTSARSSAAARVAGLPGCRVRCPAAPGPGRARRRRHQAGREPARCPGRASGRR